MRNCINITPPIPEKISTKTCKVTFGFEYISLYYVGNDDQMCIFVVVFIDSFIYLFFFFFFFFIRGWNVPFVNVSLFFSFRKFLVQKKKISIFQLFMSHHDDMSVYCM